MGKILICDEQTGRKMIADLDAHFYSKYYELLSQKNEYNLLIDLVGADDDADETEILKDIVSERLEELPIVEIRNSITGNTFDVIVLSVLENSGIYAVKEDDLENPQFYEFASINNNQNKVDLLVAMQELLNKD